MWQKVARWLNRGGEGLMQTAPPDLAEPSLDSRNSAGFPAGNGLASKYPPWRPAPRWHRSRGRAAEQSFKERRSRIRRVVARHVDAGGNVAGRAGIARLRMRHYSFQVFAAAVAESVLASKYLGTQREES